ncbi:hypothetical protein FT643_22145 [Ketobacter sp. MCCC 1A13808]|uniref:hypothetical protein n=1 Tax=Ketobacter sp. MCCC 1A13808 TaxID=2602738 RepID=UPI0012EB7CEC|nr:hypothetical protein [Ketobacter sp. MCCC 1A13808]MVF14841.1 hypothetical protein [Ketobacter sp. MCCC 1A13808]
MITVDTIQKFKCEEYARGEYAKGYYDKESYLQLVLPINEAYVSRENTHLVVGHAGADGIEFCYRERQPGIWAYYPIDNDYELKAINIASLVAGWRSGEINV